MHKHENVFLPVILVGLAMSFLLVQGVYGQATTISVDIAKAKMTWQWSQGTGGPVDKWIIRCGPTSTNYSILVELPVPAARSIPISQVTPDVGTYFCVMAAANTFGAGPSSPEVTYTAGKVPVAVSQFAITVQ